MCVIAFADVDSPRPSESMVGRMYLANEYGAGIAWREEKDGKKVVRWKKGLSMEDAQKLVQEVPKPFVIHFRIPSCGGPHKSLNHPFPVDHDAGLYFDGETEGSVLFHNGTWGDWRKFSLDTASRQPEKFPIGRWSDSRAMAWCASIYGLGILELINEKVIVFGPEKIDIFGDGWDEEEGVFVSNKGWKHRQWPPYKSNTSYHSQVPASVAGGPKEKTLQLPPASGKPGGASQETPFRAEERPAPSVASAVRGELDGEAVEEGEAAVLPSFEEGDGEKWVSCVRTSFDDTPLDSQIVDAAEEAATSEGMPSSSDLKRWALAIQPKGKVVDIAVERAERDRRLANQRKGIVHMGRI